MGRAQSTTSNAVAFADSERLAGFFPLVYLEPSEGLLATSFL